jgi:hypothetical protein
MQSAFRWKGPILLQPTSQKYRRLCRHDLKKALLAMLITGLSTAGHAQDHPDNFVIEEISLILTALTADDSAISNDYFASFDALASVPLGRGRLHIRIEANSNPDHSAVSAFLPDANKDVGSALNSKGEGRLQISGFHYDFEGGSGEWAIGLLDAPEYIDKSEVANDENTQFLGTSFVNNPSIAMPDYSLGFSYQQATSDTGHGYSVVVLASHGLADNESASYSDLVRLTGDGKGVFIAAEAFRKFGPVTSTLGLWNNSAHNTDQMTGGLQSQGNHGFYAVLDGHHEKANWNVRAGIADSEISDIKSFVGFSVEFPFAQSQLGIAAGRKRLDNRTVAETSGSLRHVEIYYRFTALDRIMITPSIQWLHGRNAYSETPGDVSNVVAGIRFGLTF